jgi:hypothetical protein
VDVKVVGGTRGQDGSTLRRVVRREPVELYNDDRKQVETVRSGRKDREEEMSTHCEVETVEIAAET